MLTDIFATRYEDRPIWSEFRESDRILLVQGYRIVAEQLWSPGTDGKHDVPTIKAWTSLHNLLSMELGRESLAPLGWSFLDTTKKHQWGTYTMDFVCKTFMLEPFKQGANPDTHMKERISFIELAFRSRMYAMAEADASYRTVWAPKPVTRNRTKQDAADNMSDALALSQNAIGLMMKRNHENAVNRFLMSCDELNERFRRAKVPLNYHNGFIQIASDPKVQEQIEKPFWDLVADPKWVNVATDMAEAIDRREANERDPAFWATRALESVIKIISTERGWTHGGEKGAHSYIDNLQASRNGSFIHPWEAESLKHLFSKVRNQLGHGPGGEKMPELTQQQTDWVIEAAMSWSKSLIKRLGNN